MGPQEGNYVLGNQLWVNEMHVMGARHLVELEERVLLF